MGDPERMSQTDVGKLIGVVPETVSTYRNLSKPGRRYERHPFPKPDGFFGPHPWWRVGREEEIREWARNRPGRGAGGGYPAQQRAQG